jgi:hypothetical protein
MAVERITAVVRRNEDKAGIEVVFSGKPSREVRDQLRALRFRWSGRQGLWWSRYSVARWEAAQTFAVERETVDPLSLSRAERERQGIVLTRADLQRLSAGIPCGHSVCSQHYVATGETYCTLFESDEQVEQRRGVRTVDSTPGGPVQEIDTGVSPAGLSPMGATFCPDCFETDCAGPESHVDVPMGFTPMGVPPRRLSTVGREITAADLPTDRALAKADVTRDELSALLERPVAVRGATAGIGNDQRHLAALRRAPVQELPAAEHPDTVDARRARGLDPIRPAGRIAQGYGNDLEQVPHPTERKPKRSSKKRRAWRDDAPSSIDLSGGQS